VGTQAVQYDAAGNLLNTGSGSGTYSYTWDAEGRMATVGSPAGTTVATYVYNALGQWVERSGSGVPSSPLYEVYDAFGNLAFVTNNGTTGESLIALEGRNFAKYTPSGTFFLHGDALGSSFFVTDWTGQNWPQAALYDPWGQQWVMWTGGYGTIDDRYAGMQERDSESWLDPTPNRMYASTYGRWLSPDPVAGDPSNPQSWNRYAYVLNNPATLSDPMGLCGEVYYSWATDSNENLLWYDSEVGEPCPPSEEQAQEYAEGGASPDDFSGGNGGGWSGTIMWPQLHSLVHQNNLSQQCDELVECIIFNESHLGASNDPSGLQSGFNAGAVSSYNARGLMQVAKISLQDVLTNGRSYPVLSAPV
jgi:RHS repeat-associated protein